MVADKIYRKSLICVVRVPVFGDAYVTMRAAHKYFLEKNMQLIKNGPLKNIYIFFIRNSFTAKTIYTKSYFRNCY